VFINVPALMSLYSAYDEVVGHQRRYNKKTLWELLDDCHLEVADIQYWGLSMIPLLFLRKIFVTQDQGTNRIIQNGFAPPNPLIHSVLKTIMSIENALVPHPFLGTSVMAVGRKMAT